MALYMKIEDANKTMVQGEVTEAKHKGWIELVSCDWQMNRHVQMKVGSAKNRESNSAECSEFTFLKNVDKASPKLVSFAFTGQGKTVTIDATRTNQGGEAIVRQIVLTNAILSHFSNPMRNKPLDGENPLQEVGSFSFTKIEISDFGSDEVGKTGSPSRTTYDLAQAKTL